MDDLIGEAYDRYVKSNITGKVIAPELDDEIFAAAWFAAVEYKTSLELQLLSWARKGAMPGHLLPEKKFQRLFISNTRDNLEDQRFTYESLARLARLLDEWAERAIKLGLI
jgi:hypothetical protein